MSVYRTVTGRHIRAYDTYTQAMEAWEFAQASPSAQMASVTEEPTGIQLAYYYDPHDGTKATRRLWTDVEHHRRDSPLFSRPNQEEVI